MLPRALANIRARVNSTLSPIRGACHIHQLPFVNEALTHKLRGVWTQRAPTHTRGGTRTRNLLLRGEAPYPLGHTSCCGSLAEKSQYALTPHPHGTSPPLPRLMMCRHMAVAGASKYIGECLTHCHCPQRWHADTGQWQVLPRALTSIRARVNTTISCIRGMCFMH